MSEHPILFSAEMVRAIIAGRTTQTRRVVKPQPLSNCTELAVEFVYGEWVLTYRAYPGGGSARHVLLKCPYDGPGDMLWVRETFFQGYATVYAAEHPNERPSSDPSDKWRPAIYMPRWASRLSLRIVDVEVERLHDISESDARAEGVENVYEYRELWDRINGKTFPWASNPWVFAITFERVESRT